MDLYKEKYEAALEAMRMFIYPRLDGDAKLAAEKCFPELRESEDERIRKFLIDILSSGVWRTEWPFSPVDCVAYLEKQKEPSLREFIDDFPYSEQKEQKPVDDSDFKTKLAEYMMKNRTGYSYIISSESILEMAKEELIKRGELKEQKPAEKQDYSGLNDLERAIHRGFLAAGVENVPVTIIKETAQDCLAQVKPAEWSDEDENALEYLHELISFGFTEKFFGAHTAADMRGWLNARLKSLRPHWKPSEEQMEALDNCVRGWQDNGDGRLISLFYDLKKL